MTLSKTYQAISIFALLAATSAAAQSEKSSPQQAFNEIQSLPWVKSGQGSVDNVASIEANVHAQVLAGEPASRFIKLSGNPPLNGATIVAPKDLHWFSVYQYRDVGYVSDKDNVEADALMKALKNREPSDNAERDKMGLEALTITDWAVKPHYDAGTHNFEWGLRLHSSRGGDVINYTTRHLGRGGFVSSVLVTSPETFPADLAEFRTSDAKLAFQPGGTYSEFREGDKVAGYGLAALVAGGVTAAAVKGGAAKGILVALVAFWKVAVAGIIAVFVGVANFARRLFGRSKEQ